MQNKIIDWISQKQIEYWYIEEKFVMEMKPIFHDTCDVSYFV